MWKNSKLMQNKQKKKVTSVEWNLLEKLSC